MRVFYFGYIDFWNKRNLEFTIRKVKLFCFKFHLKFQFCKQIVTFTLGLNRTTDALSWESYNNNWHWIGLVAGQNIRGSYSDNFSSTNRISTINFQTTLPQLNYLNSQSSVDTNTLSASITYTIVFNTTINWDKCPLCNDALHDFYA